MHFAARFQAIGIGDGASAQIGRFMIGVHRGRISGGLQKPVRGSFEFPGGLVMDGQVRPRLWTGRPCGVRQGHWQSAGSIPLVVPASRPVECFLVQHVDKRIALPRNGISGIAFPEELISE